MKNELTPINQAAAPLAAPLDKARAYAEQSTADNTKRAYSADWQHFTAWCAAQHLPSLPADEYKLATIARRMDNIGKAHHLAGHPDLTKSEQAHVVMKSIRRALGRAQTQKPPALRSARVVAQVDLKHKYTEISYACLLNGGLRCVIGIYEWQIETRALQFINLHMQKSNFCAEYATLRRIAVSLQMSFKAYRQRKTLPILTSATT